MPSNVEIVNSLIDELETLPEFEFGESSSEQVIHALRSVLKEIETVTEDYEVLKTQYAFLSDKNDELNRLFAPSSPDLGDLSELPDALFEELSIAKPDELTSRLIVAIKSYEEKATLDQIIVALFRKFGEIYERRTVQNKLYRTSGIYQVEGEKGTFTMDKVVALGDELPF